MTLTSLIRIRDASRGAITKDDLEKILAEVPVPAGAATGECLNWVIKAVEHLAVKKIVTLSSADKLREEFNTFCVSNRSYARRDRFPNTKVSEHCF